MSVVANQDVAVDARKNNAALKFRRRVNSAKDLNDEKGRSTLLLFVS